MSRLVSRAENFERVYEAFQDINFAAFDYNTVKQSLLDYIKLHFPETFNDFIETSEFIAIIETFAYISELAAYRLDIDAHENFISVAQRRDSILRLAKLISYTASRPLPARGLVKLTSVSTTESVLDANGIDLAGTTIHWNDPSNADWKDQFILVINRVLEQEFGTVGPNDRFQIQDVLFELYGVNMLPLSTGVFKYGAQANNTSVPMELVPVSHDTVSGIIERRPANNSNFVFMYASDGLGDGSETTGFLSFTKQGTLQKFRTSFDGVTPNLFYDVPASNVNDIDVWLNNVDPTTGDTLDLPNPISFRPSWFGKSGEWVQVDLAAAQNIIFNTNPSRNKYEVETRDNSTVRLIFGDGEYADVPSGTFDAWVRTSVDQDIVIGQASVIDVPSSFTYTDSFGRVQTFTFTFSLIGSLQNASAAETQDHIRQTAPGVYYTQDRMVNGQDYNTFMLQDPSILKLRAVNRTFAGDSKYIAWHDPSGSYENVKIFGDDGILYFQVKPVDVVTPNLTIDVLIANYIEPLLGSTDILVQLLTAGVPAIEIRTFFTTVEKTQIQASLTPPPSPPIAELYYNTTLFRWYAIKQSDGPATLTTINYPELPANYPTGFITTPLITVSQNGVLSSAYTVRREVRRLVFESQTTTFWNPDNANSVIDYDSITSNTDRISVLKANVNYAQNGVLSQNWEYDVLGQEVVDSGSDLGLPDDHRLSVLPVDVNNDGVPDNLDPNALSLESVADIFNYKVSVDLTTLGTPYTLTIPFYYIVSGGVVVPTSDITITGGVGVVWNEDGTPDTPSNTITFTAGTGTVEVFVNEYVYYTRPSVADQWVPADSSFESISAYIDAIVNTTQLWTRYNGRDQLNFAWFHFTSNYYLVDPAPSNIIDTLIITKGYFTELKRWLEDPLAPAPSVPTPLDLRTAYNYLLDNKMISDTVILHPGNFKLLFGSKAAPELQATFKVIRSPNGTLTDNQVKTTIVSTVRNFFDVTLWSFGETFFFTELAAAIHATLPTEISSVVLVPLFSTNQFGDLFEVLAREDEVFYPDITVDQIEIVTGYTPTNLRLNG